MNTAPQILEETRQLLLNRPVHLTLVKIAEVTELSESWLSKFGRGEIENPGVVTVYRLNEYLKNYKKQ